MFIHFLRFNRLFLFILLSIYVKTAFASQQIQMSSESATDVTNSDISIEDDALKTSSGLIMLDYEVIPVPGNESIDLLGLHYLHQLNRWLYLGLGAHAPLVYGNYGGFMAIDVTIHAQRRLFGNSFIDAGVSLGGGGGGSSIEKSKELSGKGGYFKSYLGLGYNFRGCSLGVNYANFQFIDSLINHSQFNLFIQKPVSFSIGSYANSGKKTTYDFSFSQAGENILTFELNNIFQVNPEGLNEKNINTISLQFSHFLNKNHYLFFGGDVGYNGLPLYNQILGGLGYKYPISDRILFYNQIAVGSGGFSPDVIDTGSGLLVYPKLSVEYLLNNKYGLSLSGGYLFAPTGSSKNITIGASINYHPSAAGKNLHGDSTAKTHIYKGFRVNVSQQTEFDVRFGNKKHGNINLLSVQLDKIVNDNWYIPFKGSVAYNEFFGYPGYGEILTGLGLQSKFHTTNHFQSFFQILVGANVHSILAKPSIGLNYSLSDNLALYGQVGKTISIYKSNLYASYNETNERLNTNFICLGLTYRFSLLDSL